MAVVFFDVKPEGYGGWADIHISIPPTDYLYGLDVDTLAHYIGITRGLVSTEFTSNTPYIDNPDWLKIILKTEGMSSDIVNENYCRDAANRVTQKINELNKQTDKYKAVSWFDRYEEEGSPWANMWFAVSPEHPLYAVEDPFEIAKAIWITHERLTMGMTRGNLNIHADDWWYIKVNTKYYHSDSSRWSEDACRAASGDVMGSLIRQHDSEAADNHTAHNFNMRKAIEYQVKAYEVMLKETLKNMKMSYRKKLTLSESFKERLEGIKKDSRVAEFLLRPFYNTAKNFDFVTYRTSTEQLAYCPSSKEQQFNENGTWIKHNYRQAGKPAKVARKLLNGRALRILKEKDFEVFANKIKAVDLEILNSRVSIYDNVCDIYDSNNYASEANKGTLDQSCMNDDLEYVEWYNEIGCQGLALHDGDGDIIARALIWHNVIGLDGGTFVDRIYGTDSSIEKLKAYSRNKGWHHKAYQNYSDKTDFVDPYGIVISRAVRIAGVGNPSNNLFPYCDTMTYWNDESGDLTNNDTGDFTHELTDTSGGYDEGSYGEYCVDTERRCQDAAWVERYDQYYEDVRHSSYNNEEIPADEAVWCENLDTYLWDDRVVELHDGELMPTCHGDVVCLHDGQYALIDDAFECEHDGNIYLESNRATASDGAEVYYENIKEYENELQEEVVA